MLVDFENVSKKVAIINCFFSSKKFTLAKKATLSEKKGRFKKKL